MNRSGHVDARDIPAHPHLYPYSHALMVVSLRQIDRIVRLAVSGSDRVEAPLQRDSTVPETWITSSPSGAGSLWEGAQPTNAKAIHGMSSAARSLFNCSGPPAWTSRLFLW